MVAAIQELSVTRSLRLGLGVIGMVAMAALLSGCGRKGPLDPPPGGWAMQPGPAGVPPVTDRAGAEAPPQYDSQGRPIAPSGPKRRLPGDWLLD
jgi:hypothetical protein